jgi:hypothetical protein
MPDPGILASDAERDQTMERLRAAAGEGRLTLEELTDRIETASASRTREELERMTADLPPVGIDALALAAGSATGAAAPEVRPTQQVTTVLPRNSSFFGDLKRSGPWQLPATSQWDTFFGDVKLDLREAHVPAGEIVIEARTFFGDIELLVPEGVIVDVHGKATFGDVKQDAGMSGAAGAPRIVLTGGTVFGDVRVQAKRLRERLAERLRRSGR